MRLLSGAMLHRRYVVFVVMDEKGEASQPVCVEHDLCPTMVKRPDLRLVPLRQ